MAYDHDTQWRCSDPGLGGAFLIDILIIII
jgi:hypothetical protein